MRLLWGEGAATHSRTNLVKSMPLFHKRSRTLRTRPAPAPAAPFAPCFRAPSLFFHFLLNSRTRSADIVSMTRILRSSSNFRNRIRKTYSFFVEYAGNSVCVFEVPCFNSAHAARVCAKLSAKFKMPMEYAL